ncbi:MAG TPA: LytR C-terminal domain-containing protein [Nocardioidaceae bacterium]|nr:LytR C-terminal domain-containing protein [Nocardioidaceae bacterium]
MRRLVGRVRTQRGLAMSSPLALLSVGAVVLAGAAFVATSGHEDEPATRPAAAARPATTTATPAPTPTSTAPAPVVKKKPTKKPVVRRGGTYVEVYNNSGISGLAGSTAARAQGAGWEVVGSDNWYGTIPASTVYYPARLHAQAKLLGKDLGISRLKPSIAPMRGDRLTVILTSDYS